MGLSLACPPWRRRPAAKNGTARIFELRTYEAPNDKALARKIKMFGDGEIDIFRRCGMLTVFFGQTIVGSRMPNLTYMLAYDDLAARDKTWARSPPIPNGRSCAPHRGCRMPTS